MDLSPGFLLHDRYKIVRLLGQGGMGAVYLANDQSLANEVAVKINRSDSPKAGAQFIAEARLLATLRHPNLPRVIDYFQIEGEGQFLVMDYIAGQDLKTLLEQNAVPPLAQVLEWAVQLGAALSYLHRQYPPVFHRDVKPANLKLTSQNELVLVDFGIAKAAAASSETSTGASLLSPGYAPPEQYGVGHTGAYSDQYAMGATFYQLLTGQLPADAFQRLMGKATLVPVQQLNPSVPQHVDQAIQRAMALRVEDRFSSVDDFVQALTHPGANASYQPNMPAQPIYPATMPSGFPPMGGVPPATRSGGIQSPSQPTYPPPASGYPPPATQSPYPQPSNSGQPQGNFPPSQPPYGQAQPPATGQPQGNFPPSQPPYGQPQAPVSGQPQGSYPPSQPPYGQAQPTGQPQGNYPPSQPPYGQPQAAYPPAQSPYPQPQAGYPSSQPPYSQVPQGGYVPPAAMPKKRFPWLWVGIVGVVLLLGCGGIIALVTAPLTPTPTPTAVATSTVRAATQASSSTVHAATATVATLAATNVVSPTAPAPIVPTTAKSPTAGSTATQASQVLGTPLQNPAAFVVKYFTYFQDRPNGFSDPSWDVTLATGAKVTTKDSILSVLGGVQAYSAKVDLGSEYRVYLGGGIYGFGLTDFTLFVQRSKDNSSYLRMTCLDQNKNNVLTLHCDWWQQAGGKETHLENAAGDLCSGKCDIEVELDNGTFRVYANQVLKITFKNTQLSTGGIGLRINNPTQTPYTLDKIAVYKLPKTSSVGGYLLLDDMGESWPTGHTDNDFATIDRSVSSELYDWTVTSKQSLFTRANPSPDFTIPDRFDMFVDIQQLSGPEDACYGLIYRYVDTNNFYFYCVSDQGTITVRLKQNGTWITLVDAMKTSSINAGELNTLEVVGDGTQYTFYVNDTQVTKLTDDRLKTGSFGLAGELYAASQTAEWEYSLVQINQLPK